MCGLVETENPRVSYVVEDTLEDVQAGVCQLNNSIPLFLTNKSNLFIMGGYWNEE